MMENNQTNILDFEITDEDIENIFSNEDLDRTKKRETFLKNLNQYLEVQAVPGSGKTKILGVKIGLLLKKWKYKNSGICVLTHTNVAKEEILKSCREINQNCELEHFPHFIGTIQEFVDKFWAIPYLKSYIKDFEFNYIDDKYSFLPFNLKIKHKNLESEYKLCYLLKNKLSDLQENLYFTSFNSDNSKCKLNYDFKNIEYFVDSKGKKRNNIEDCFIWFLKEYQIKKGHLIYKDMYAFANALIEKSPIVLDYIRNRFKVCFVDEAQDTNKIQGELLKKIFKESENNIFQILGDKNQKIYDFDSNNDYSIFDDDGNLITMTKTYRFCSNIGDLVNSFAIDKNYIVEYYPKENKQDEQRPYLILYDNPKNVLGRFIETLEENGLTRIDKEIVIVGAVGKEKNNTVISSYIENFSKNNNENKFKTKNIIEALNFVKNNKVGDFKENYKIIFNTLLCNFDNDKYISNNDKLEKKITAKENLEKIFKENNFNQKIIEILNDKNEITAKFVEKILFSESTKQFFNFEGLLKNTDNSNNSDQNKKNDNSINIITTSRNTYSYQYNFSKNEIEFSENKKFKFKIKVNTIHGVKGETHDATLVLETFNHVPDISYFLKDLNTKSYNKLRHNLYVAFSRPKTLLCLASSKVECQKISEDVKKLFNIKI